jgi:tripeptidyl-peptidase-1
LLISQTIPPRYARAVCNLYAQLGSRGVSVIFSSGDSGVGTGCVSNDGKNTTRFLPQFPASCPFVTSVGATQGQNETAAAFSSGGFSDLWKRPPYQDEAISAYLSILGDQWQGLYNPEGRGFPDVSAVGVNYAVVDKGSLGAFEGTSASGPTFAAIIALLNDARLRAGEPVLGFLNPWLYSEGYKALNDITAGGSNGCDGRSRFSGPPFHGGAVIPGASWKAVKGWDPVTGFGTPDFSKLLKLVV